MNNIIWSDRKRWIFLGLPFSFTKYTLLEDKILIDTGFLNSEQEEVRLYRILDISLNRSLAQKIVGLGTITCKTADKTLPTLILKNVKNSQELKEKISSMVEEERVKKRASIREYMSDDNDNNNDDDDNDFDLNN